MKKIITIGLILIILTTLTIVNSLNKKNDDKKKITVAEVTHSIFYAPFYVALEKGYFEDLDIELVLTSGANNVVAAVISGDADIGFCGPEATIYATLNGNKDTIKSFAALTKRDGQFLVLRKGIEFNDMSDLEGLTILAGRSGGMPLLNFKNALKNTNTQNVTIDDSVDFANLTSAFISGSGDGVNLFEPNATKLVLEGYGYIATNIGTYSGVVPYTTFNASSSFIKENKDVINTFYKGIEKGLKFVKENDAITIKDAIKNQFKETSDEELITMIDNYKKADSWYTTPKLISSDFTNLQDIMIDNKEIKEYVDFNTLVHVVNID